MIYKNIHSGFLLQIVLNASVRLLYMYIIYVLASDATEISIKYSIVLGLATQLAPFFILSLYKYVISIITTSKENGIKSCYFQYSILLKINALFVFIYLLSLTFGVPNIYLLALISAISLALTEVNYTLATVNKIELRALFNYGAQLVFFLIIYIFIDQESNIEISFIIASISLLIISHFFFYWIKRNNKKTKKRNIKEIKHEYIIRIKSFLGDLPVLLVIPSMMLFLGHGQADNIPKLLLFISLSGSVVFFFGNFYQYYGRHYLSSIVRIIDNRETNVIFIGNLLILLFCFIFSYVVAVITSLLSLNIDNLISNDWVYFVAIYSFCLVISQWFSLICLHKDKIKYVLLTNIFFIISIFLIFFASEIFTSIDYLLILTLSAVLRFIGQLALLFFGFRIK